MWSGILEETGHSVPYREQHLLPYNAQPHVWSPDSSKEWGLSTLKMLGLCPQYMAACFKFGTGKGPKKLT